MEEVDYQNFFNNFQQFKAIQKKQKQRGLNDFNLLTTVLKYSDEVRLHSRMIGNLLNPNAKHYQDTLFLEKFLNIIGLDKWGLDLSSTSVSIEYKDIDLYITDGDKHIIIENKIWAKDQPCQIMKYINIIVEENKGNMDLSHIKNDHIILDKNILQVIYLTPRRKSVSFAHKIDDKGYIFFDGEENADDELSKCSKKDNTELLVPDGLKKYKASYKKITYREHIVPWLKESQIEIRNITSLNESIQQYIDVVARVNGKYKGNVMNLSKFMNSNEELYDITADIVKELSLLKLEIESLFWEEMKVALNEVDSFEDYTNKKIRFGLKSNTLNLIVGRAHNLHYIVENIKSSKQVELEQYVNFKYKNKVVTFAYIPNSTNLINFEKGNKEFWKLGKKTFREGIIDQTVKIVQDIKKLLEADL